MENGSRGRLRSRPSDLTTSMHVASLLLLADCMVSSGREREREAEWV